MEFAELEAMWQQYDKKLSDNTRLNKEIFRQMLITKPEKRLTCMKSKAITNLILPFVLILWILVPHIQYRNTNDFFLGLLLFGVVFIILYYWSIRYYLLIEKINFMNPITLLKKRMYQLEKYKIKITKLGYILMPVGMIGIFLMGEFPLLSLRSLLPISLIILVLIISIYFTFKFSIFELFKKINLEIAEIEQLEKE